MKLLDRYIFSEIFKVFVLGFTALMAIFILEKVNFISKIILDSDVTLKELALLIAYISPAFMTLTLPLAVLLASLVTFSHLSADQEITAMRACGVSFYRILVPVGAFGILVFAFASYLSIEVQHSTNDKYMDFLTSLAGRKAHSQIGEGVFHDRLPNTVIFVNERKPDSNALKRVFIYDMQDKQNPRLITAASGELSPGTGDMVLKLNNGSIYSGGKESFRLINYGEYQLFFDAGGSAGFERQPREMSIREIRGKITAQPAQNGDANKFIIEIHKRYSLPFSSLILAFLGAALGIRVQRGGKWGGLGLGVVVIMLNYLLLMAAEGLGREGTLPAEIAMWLPNLILGTLTAFLVYVGSRESMPFRSTIWLQSAWINAMRRLYGKRPDDWANGT